MFEDYSQARNAVLGFMDSICAYAKEDGKEKIAQELQNARDHLESSRYNVAVMGFMCRGKSTLINTLLGRINDEISPIAAEVCTSAICEYVDMKLVNKTNEAADVVFKNGRSLSIPLSEIRDYVTEGGNEDNNKKVHKVTVYGNFPILHEAAILVDTPGGGAIQSYHDDLLTEFLPLADAIILLIAADLPLEIEEIKFLKTLKEREKGNVFFVLTKCDEIETENDKRKVISFVMENIAKTGMTCTKLYETSAQLLYDARRDGVVDKTEMESIRQESGMAELEADIERHTIEHSDKTKVTFIRIKAALECVHSYCAGEIARLDGELSKFNKDVYTLNNDLKKMEMESNELLIKQSNAAKKFEEEWDQHITRFLTKIDNNIDPVVGKIEARLQKGLIGKTLQAYHLSDVVNMEVQTVFVKSNFELVNTLEKAIATLHKETTEDVSIYVKKAGISDGSGKAIAVGTLALSSGGVLLGGGSIVTSLTGMTAAWAGYAAQLTTAANAGAITSVKTWALGSAVQGATLGTAIGTTIAAITTGGLIIAGIWIGKIIIEATIDVALQGKIPRLVEETFNEIGKGIKKNLDRQKDMIIDSYKEKVAELISTTTEEIQAIKEAIEKNDPKLKLQLEEKRIRLLVFQEDCVNKSQQMSEFYTAR